jgi:hypothetical protein
MHQKEIAVLEGLRVEQEEELVALKQVIPSWQQELDRLRAIGPLPVDIAKRLNMSPEGYRLNESIPATVGS